MGLAQALSALVPERTRTRGNRYFLGGAVRAIEGSARSVTATVRGSKWYRVTLTRDHDRIAATCECPVAADGIEACKHIWAVVLAADASGFLVTGAPAGDELYLDLVEYVPAEDPEFALPPAPSAAEPEPWQRFLASVQQRLLTERPASPSRYREGEILYVLDRPASQRDGLPSIQVQWRTLKKTGEWTRPQPAAIGTSDLLQIPGDADREILTMLIGASDPFALLGSYASVYSRSSFRLLGPLAARALPLLGASGRLYLRRDAPVTDRRGRGGRTAPPADAEELTPLAWDDGPPWVFELDVTEERRGRLRVEGAFVRADTRMPVARPDLVFADGFVVADGLLARMEHHGTYAWLAELRKAGPAILPPEAAPSLVEAMAQSNVAPAHLPDALRYDIVEAAPKPRIRFARSSRPQGLGTREVLEAAVQFDYDGSILATGDESSRYDAERRRLVRRDRAAETSALQRLQKLGFHRPWYLDGRQGALAVNVERFPEAVRALVDEGWHVEAEGRAFRAARNLELQVKSGIDWFELHGRVDFGEGRSATIADLLAALRRGEATVLLDDGTRGLVPEEWLRRYARIAAFGEAAGDHVRYRSSQAVLLDALLEAQPSVRVDEVFARARQELARFEGVQPLDPPPGFQGRLREYQRHALGWFAFLRQFGFGGCLADDMGLGKTVMVLALLESRRQSPEGERRPSLAVVPRSLIFNWTEEAARFAPALRVLDYTGDARSERRLDDHDLILTTYGTLRRDVARLADHEFDYLILDEAQAIKNAATASAKAVRVLRGRHRLALSGTPIENHLGEVWSLFEFLNPGFLGPAAAFGRLVGPQVRAGRAERPDVALLGRALRPFILRRTKAQVAPELPEKVEQTIQCELEPPQRKFYDELRTHYRQTLLSTVARRGLNRSKLQVLEALLRLRQAASHVGLVDERRSHESSAKFEMLLSRLREIADEGHKALVFSQFTSLLALLRPRLDAEGIRHEYLDGRTKDRAARVASFEGDPGLPVFLISLKAGGVGLNLTSAEYVFLLDPWWNPAVEAQAIDRTHRIGQTRHVFAYRLIARDTVEEKIAELQQTKRHLADAIFSEDAGLMRTLQPGDLDWILS